MTDTDEPELSAREAARLLGIHVSTLGRYARKGLVRFRTLPSGRRRYRPSDLKAARIEHEPQENTP